MKDAASAAEQWAVGVVGSAPTVREATAQQVRWARSQSSPYAIPSPSTPTPGERA